MLPLLHLLHLLRTCYTCWISCTDPGALKTSGLTEVEWIDAVIEGFLFAMVQSYIVIDGAKAFFVAITAALANSDQIVRHLPKNTLRRTIFLLPLRRMHTILESIA
jgi:hypothetical protein